MTVSVTGFRMFFNISLNFYRFSLDRVCQQQGLSLWVPFQNAATAVTNLYKGKRLLSGVVVCFVDLRVSKVLHNF